MEHSQLCGCYQGSRVDISPLEITIFNPFRQGFRAATLFRRELLGGAPQRFKRPDAAKIALGRCWDWLRSAPS